MVECIRGVTWMDTLEALRSKIEDRLFELFSEKVPHGGGDLDWPARLGGIDIPNAVGEIVQAAHCASRGLEVRHMDLDHEIPDGAWSVGWWMESLEHLEEPEKALARLRPRCEKLVIRVNTCEAARRRLFAGSMPMRPARFYVDALHRAGWKVTHLSNRRPASVRSPFEWLGGLRSAGIVCPDDPHLRALWDYSMFFTTKPWMYASFPLVDIVAE